MPAVIGTDEKITQLHKSEDMRKQQIAVGKNDKSGNSKSESGRGILPEGRLQEAQRALSIDVWRSSDSETQHVDYGILGIN